MYRRALRFTPILALSIALGSCSLIPGLSQECVSWVPFNGDQQQLADSAELIVVGTVSERDGEADLLGGNARLYRFAVDEASDERYVGREITIASRADGCAADPFGHGDPLDTEARVAVFLSSDQQWSGLAILTPFDGVVPAEELTVGLEAGQAPAPPPAP